MTKASEQLDVALPRGSVDSLRAWGAAISATVAVCVTYGLAYSYGEFFSSISSAFGSNGAAAAVFSVTSLIYFSAGVVTGPLADRWGPRPVLVIASVVLGVGLFLTSRSTAMWQAYLTYTGGVGLGVGFTYVPAVASVGRWFERQRGPATGLVVSGVSLGTMASPPLSAWMISNYGWRHSYEVFAFAGALLLLLCAVFLPRPPHRAGETAARGPVPVPVEPQSGRRGFSILYLAVLFTSIVIYVPFVYLGQYARQSGISEVAASGLVSVIGASSIGGRLVLSVLADRVPMLSLFKGCCWAIAVSPILWAAVDTYVGLAAYAVLLGVSYGGFIALTPLVVSRNYGLTGLSRSLGILYTAGGLGSFLGPVIAGYVIDATGSYRTALLSLAVLGLIGAVFAALYRDPHRGT